MCLICRNGSGDLYSSKQHSDAKRIPIIAMTANAFEEDAKKCLAAGMNEHLAKTFQMEQVITTIAKYCNRLNDVKA